MIALTIDRMKAPKNHTTGAIIRTAKPDDFNDEKAPTITKIVQPIYNNQITGVTRENLGWGDRKE